ncbi:MAG TPA: FG-GAP-like repeat-containing protein [Intrasporangium sp.]|nr:FG-GAP-like repeat-containing protein [Intrasporangium sp.]
MSHRTTVAAVLSGLVIGVCAVTNAPGASAATMFGHDISWPQCPSSVGGYDLPMPPTSTQFVIVGLTKGLPFTENPCLASQVSWVKNNAKPAQAYTMAAYPTSAQLTTYGSQGPWSSSTTWGKLSNVGYSQARFAVASLAKVGFEPPVVWIDVEPRTAQPWPTGTAARQRSNRYVLEGLMRGLRDAGYPYGLYSYTAGWQDITGSWLLPGVPVWATAGKLDYPAEAADRCTQTSFSGGRVYLSQWYDDQRDYDRTCGTYAFTALPMPPSSLSNSTADFNGDWVGDVLARVAATGELRIYPGTTRGTLATGARIGTGWSGFDVLETPGDLNGDGAPDVMARERSTGYLWLYRGNGKGGWLPRVRLGTGWNSFDVILGPGDFNGDQRADVLARQKATGYLFLYAGTGTGALRPGVRVGTGWNIFSSVVGTGDLNGDGFADVVARERSTGYLWLYPGNGKGGWLARVRLGTGWNGMTAIMSPGDLNGDRVPDIVARDSGGRLWLYPRTTSGWLARVALGTGWNFLDRLF